AVPVPLVAGVCAGGHALGFEPGPAPVPRELTSITPPARTLIVSATSISGRLPVARRKLMPVTGPTLIVFHASTHASCVVDRHSVNVSVSMVSAGQSASPVGFVARHTTNGSAP